MIIFKKFFVRQLFIFALLLLPCFVEGQNNSPTPGQSCSNSSKTELKEIESFPENKSTQIIQINSPGWYLISSYLSLSGTPISTLLQPVANKLFAVIDEDGGAYIPSMFANNIGNWQKKAYKVKFTQPCQISLSGSQLTNKSFVVNGPATFLPVLSSSAIDITTLFAGNLSQVNMIYDLSNSAIWTPDIQMFTSLVPGYGYLLITNTPNSSFTINFGAKSDNESDSCRMTEELADNNFNMKKDESPKLLVPWVDIIPSEMTICIGNFFNSTGLINAGNHTSVFWFVTDNTGSFDNPYSLETDYYPGGPDFYKIGYADLYVYVSDGISAYDFDQIRIYFVEPPEIDAGEDATVTAGNSFTLTGTIGENCSGLQWNTSGDGYFDDQYDWHPTYYFGPEDIDNGSVELCVEAGGLSDCEPVSDCMNLTFQIITTDDEITLSPGWSLISFDVIPFSSNPVNVFAPLISTNNLVIVTGFQNQMGVFFDPDGPPFLNTLQNLLPGEGYWVKVQNAATLTVEGFEYPMDFLIDLKTGWNLIAYWQQETTTPEAAFEPLITAGILEMVTGYELGGKFYDPTGQPFLNTLTEIKNGFGYWVKVSEDYPGFSHPEIWECGDMLMDERDGQGYETVQIGTQCWMKENLNIGTRISGSSNQTNNATIEKYCYSNSDTQCDVYGGIYQWNEMMGYATSAGVQGICPFGWHLPTDAEWTALTGYVSLQPEYLCNSNATYIAKALAATTTWNTYSSACTVGNDPSANNATGFTALPGGGRYNDGSFYFLGNNGYWWSSTESTASNAWHRGMYYYSVTVTQSNNDKSFGFSVRCLKN